MEYEEEPVEKAAPLEPKIEHDEDLQPRQPKKAARLPQIERKFTVLFGIDQYTARPYRS